MPCTCYTRAVHMPYACGMHAMCMHCACASTQALAAGLFPVRFVTGRAGDVALAFGSLWHSSSSAHWPSPPRLALLFEYAPSFVKPLHRYAPALVDRLVPFRHRRLFPQVRLAPRRAPAPAHKAPARRRACPLPSPPPCPTCPLALPPCRKGRRPASPHAALAPRRRSTAMAARGVRSAAVAAVAAAVAAVAAAVAARRPWR